MEFRSLIFSGHAVRRMFERSISPEDVRAIVESGEVIADYPDDTPYPSRLMLGFARGQPLHIVVALEQVTGQCHVITVYVPDQVHWEPDLRTRRRR